MFGLISGYIGHLDYHLNVPVFHIVLEVVLISALIYLYYKKSFPIHPHDFKLKLSKQLQDQLIEEWQPDPLVPDDSANPINQRWDKIISSKPTDTIVVNGVKCINFATTDFHQFIGNAAIEESAVEIVSKYGVGTCGPRLFYGTNDVHLNFEKCVAEFLRVESAVLYSYGIACISSSIPAYIKYKDYAFVDETINSNILVGLKASKANVFYYSRNNLADLESKLEQIQAIESKNTKKFKTLRFFVIAEAVSQNYGEIADLKKLIQLKFKYRFRIFLDETLSFGILGETGRGLTEYHGVDPNVVDLIMVNLETTFATTGGFCAGSRYAMSHQSLSSLAYCFSASLPSYLADSAQKAIEIIDKNPEMLVTLRDCSTRVYDYLCEKIPQEYFRIDGQPGSSIFHIRFLPNIYTLNEQIAKLCAFEKMIILEFQIAFNIKLPILNSNAEPHVIDVEKSDIGNSFDSIDSIAEDNQSDYISRKNKEPKPSIIAPSIIVPINTGQLRPELRKLDDIFDPLIECLKRIIKD